MRLALIALCLSTAPAHAALTFCNETDTTVSVAIGYSEDDVWTSEGWWVAAAGDCKVVVGGELSKRYYYWRATSDDYTWDDERYFFCTSPEEFTIEGDTNCDSRGYDRVQFNEIDLDGRTDFTMTLTAQSANQPAPAPAPAPQTSGPAPGTYGEPYSISGILSYCQVFDVTMECELLADGWRYIANSADPTPLAVLEDLERLGVNRPLSIAGDMIGYEGNIAQVTIREWSLGGPDPYASIRQRLQGIWQSPDDEKFVTLIHGGMIEDYYDGNPSAQATFDVVPTCDGALGAGPALSVIYTDMTDDDPLCWVIVELNSSYMEMHAAGAMKPFRMLKQ